MIGSFFPGICLTTGLLRQGARIASMALFMIFLVAQTSVLMRGVETGCGCFGNLQEPVDFYTLLRTGFLFLLAWLLYRPDRKTVLSHHRNAGI